MELPPIVPAQLSSGTELVVLGVLLAVAALFVLAAFSDVPYPILFVLGGLTLGFVPGAPNVMLQPDLVLVIVLPPLLYSAAFFSSSLRDLRANLRPISLLSVGLVLATTFGVAAIAHALITDLSWKAAVVLGAIVSPTDPIAATSIAERFNVPRRVVTIVEGESMINDAMALIVYKFAVAAVVSGTFSLSGAALEFLGSTTGGIGVGLVVGWIVAQVRRRLDDPPTEIALSLLTAYFAYLPAEALGVSGVLAAVTVGIYLGWRAPQLVTSPTTRLQSQAVWEILVFVVNAFLFALLGLQFQNLVERLHGYSAQTLLGYGALVGGAVVVIRIAWVFPLTYLPRYLFRRIRERDPYPPWQNPMLVSWMGMRGAVSLAAALALPLETDAGAPFPARDLIIFLTFCVILVTLVFQGLTLPALIRKLRTPEDHVAEREEVKARKHAAKAAIARIDDLAAEDWVRDETADRMRALYDYRLRRFAARYDDGDDGQLEQQSLGYQRLRREALDAERAAVQDLRNRGQINDEVMNRVVRDLDLEDTRLEI
jgi:CPA1 family monovalent cation:H+ antiporter